MKEIDDNQLVVEIVVENEIENFLQKHPLLVAALPKIQEIIMQYFENAVFEQSINIDVEEYHTSLVVKIFTGVESVTMFQRNKIMFHDPALIEIIKVPAVIYFLTLDFQSKSNI